jgi:hypothetical protein
MRPLLSREEKEALVRRPEVGERIAVLGMRPMRSWTLNVGALLLCGLFYAGLPFVFGFGRSDWHTFYGTDLLAVLPVVLFPGLAAGTFFGVRSIAGGSSRDVYIGYLLVSIVIVSLLVPLYYLFGMYLGPKRGSFPGPYRPIRRMDAWVRGGYALPVASLLIT